MGATTPLIRSVEAPTYGHIIVETTDGNRYEADLMTLSGVYCFPRNQSEWGQVSIDSYGLGLVWANRFEVHVDQVIGLATRVERAHGTRAAG